MMKLVNLAIEKTMAGKATFCKLLSPNDSGETGGHQSGFLISKTAKDMLFSAEDLKSHIAKKDIKVLWQNDFITDGCFTWYESKNELRLTRFTRGFELMGPEYTGALFVLIKNSHEDYEGYIFNTEDEIDEYLNAFGLSPAETNRPVELNNVSASAKEKIAIDSFISNLEVDFPSSVAMASAARAIAYAAKIKKALAITNPDKVLLEWTDEEYTLFRALEQSRYGNLVTNGFSTVDEFVALANQVLNRRKSRAGKSLEHHLAALFDENNLLYTAQAITEGNKKPDFIFPSQDDYHNADFPTERLAMLAAKTTCKDRWRQVLNEANRLKDGNKYLCTLQQGISAMQMDEMESEKVILVVPKPYITTYPKDRQNRIWTVQKFISYIKELENV